MVGVWNIVGTILRAFSPAAGMEPFAAGLASSTCCAASNLQAAQNSREYTQATSVKSSPKLVYALEVVVALCRSGLRVDTPHRHNRLLIFSRS